MPGNIGDSVTQGAVLRGVRMITITIISIALLIGGIMGFFVSGCLPMGKETTPAPPYQGGDKGEAKRPCDSSEDIKGFDEEALKKWEREQDKKEKRRRG